MKVNGQEANEFQETRRSIRGRWSWIVLSLICALATSHAQTAAPKIREPKQPNLSGGKRVFESNCASCHGLNGKGGERAPDIATKPEAVKLSDSETLRIMREGILQ